MGDEGGLIGRLEPVTALANCFSRARKSLTSSNSLQDRPSFHKSRFLMQEIAPPLLHRQLYLEANDLVFLREDCTKRALMGGSGDSICQMLLYQDQRVIIK